MFSFVLGFVPPSQLKTGSTVTYVALLVVAVVVLSLPPFLFALRRIRPTVRRRVLSAESAGA